jgi:hypothetical protein
MFTDSKLYIEALIGLKLCISKKIQSRAADSFTSKKIINSCLYSSKTIVVNNGLSFISVLVSSKNAMRRNILDIIPGLCQKNRSFFLFFQTLKSLNSSRLFNFEDFVVRESCVLALSRCNIGFNRHSLPLIHCAETVLDI